MISENDLNLGLDDVNLDDIDAGDGIGDIGDFNDLFKDDNWGGGGGQPGSPNSPKRNSISRANSPGDHTQERSDQFRYGQVAMLHTFVFSFCAHFAVFSFVLRPFCRIFINLRPFRRNFRSFTPILK